MYQVPKKKNTPPQSSNPPSLVAESGKMSIFDLLEFLLFEILQFCWIYYYLLSFCGNLLMI